MNKGLIAIIVIVIVAVVAAGAWFLMTPAPSNNTTNNTTNINTTPNTGNTTPHNTTNATNITAAKAKELAGQYIGMGASLEDPTLTTYNGIQVWKVPVVTYTPEKSYQDPIYINAQNGNRVT